MDEHDVGPRGMIAAAIDTSAQLAIDEPDRLTACADDLHRRIACTFGLSVADRAARAVVMTILDHRASLREIDWMLGCDRTGAPLLAPDDGVEHYIAPASSSLRTWRYRGTKYEPFLNTLAYWHRRAYAAVVAELHDQAGDPLLRELQDRQHRFSNGRSTLEMLLAQGPLEQVEIALVLLVARQRACAHHGADGRPFDLPRLVIGDLTMLGDGTTLRRARLRQILPRFPSVTDDIASGAVWPDQSTDADLLAGTDRVFDEVAHPHAQWRHPMLRGGPALDPGFCTGRPVLSSRTGEAFSSASILLTFAARVAGEAPWPQTIPTQFQKE